MQSVKDVGVTPLRPFCSTPLTQVPDVVLIPPFYVILLASVLCCLWNTAFNYFMSRPGKLAHTIRKWGRILRLTRRTKISNLQEPSGIPPSCGEASIETDGLLGTSIFTGDNSYDTFFIQRMSDTELQVEAPLQPHANVLNNALRDSLRSVRKEAQHMVFVYNPKYMIVATVKSLMMLVVLQYHFDYKGGWDRLVVCSAANLMSGLLTPVLEYGARLLLPLDLERGTRGVIVEPEEPADSVLIVEVLGHIGRLELEDLETVLIQGSTFIVFGAALLPAVVVFCLAGVASFLWLFLPVWTLYMVVRRLYYGHIGELEMQRPSLGPMNVFLTPAGEFAKAAFLKVMTLFLLQWTVQCSFLLGLLLLQGGGYEEALQLEASHQFWGCYNIPEMTRFEWLCFASQILF
ncbi:hypothetical protein C3747_9g271 [Trypanosoma cruzi]|uniref:Uncharacterized protein n=2 Tax=Trypanosoma cruzi TaxID=5693 RepID=Q4D863_TRYCC|nr:hypothetical protein, conserved [Trypanosoma cruzi]EAN88720.1 hypothetical protein, conserved [Trypanosoma cruzi]PWV19661.1 hypothetical protein C3747_9g271 [Trypanosoma cruzi]RNC48676.1 hypothetical protein TcCL_NonESM01335 [Trypanosoma cruzi]|eukprot:XP_810571.1 hypothetical protein [Trypanosoma cruzi strain CL Brener]